MSKKPLPQPSESQDIGLLLLNGFRNLFDLSFGQATHEQVVENIKESAELRSANLWVLLLAILIASVGLNLNSTAVIIGAMLVSPLMGPIMAIGLGVAINDFDLLRRAAFGIGVAAGASILVSTIYFAISPLDIEGNELLARTTPTAWDALIAIFGGLAGAVGITRNEKTNVIPGVAIATALMPPLCTAGFGIASGNFAYFAGALYLFYVNSICIALGTVIVCRVLKYPRISYLDPIRRRHVRRTIIAVLTISLLPSAYFGYNLVKRTIFEKNANQFVQKEISSLETQILSKNISYEKQSIEVVVLGRTLSKEQHALVNKRLDDFGLGNVKLSIRSGIDLIARSPSQSETQAELEAREKANLEQLLSEMKAIFPKVRGLAIANTSYIQDQDEKDPQKVTLVYVNAKENLGRADIGKLSEWLQVRTRLKIKIITD